MPYFHRTGGHTFAPTEHTTGAWNEAEQHVAPSLGLMTHLVESDLRRRRGDDLTLSRLSFDILGVVPVEEVAVEVRLRRPGRTIELVEAELTHAGRPVVVLRAWAAAALDTTDLAATDLTPIDPPDTMSRWPGTELWPGGFIASAEIRRGEVRPGRGAYWVRTDQPLLDGEDVGPLARAAGLLDIANGMVVRADPTDVAFPNLDLTAHLVRTPRPGWLGFDTTVTFGPAGLGLTSSTIHDEAGPLGTVAQTLTVRPSRHRSG
ncbi:thioesterase family protein [Nocardioides sp. C4-1]|uniref:thioesterase family protein n=1 Tax=Nocardioides sp. C4-1 TaxID=3151851 RepID=UPI0032668D56